MVLPWFEVFVADKLVHGNPASSLAVPIQFPRDPANVTQRPRSWVPAGCTGSELLVSKAE